MPPDSFTTPPDDLKMPPDVLMLTTMDNPYNPKEDYDKWRNWDIDKGYNTENLLARIANIPPDVEDDPTIRDMTTDAMLEIVSEPDLGPYKLV